MILISMLYDAFVAWTKSTDVLKPASYFDITRP